MHEFIIMLGDSFDQEVTSLGGLLNQISGNVFNRVLCAHGLVVPKDRLHDDQINDAGKLRLCTDLNIDRHSASAQTIDDRRGRVHGIRTGLVHFIDEADTGNLILGGLTPYRLRLRLHTGNRIEAGDRTVEHAERTLHLGRKVHVAGGINDVDAMILPGARWSQPK